MPRRAAILQVVVVLLLAAQACEERLDPPEVEFAGCWEVLVGPVCALGEERNLHLWLRAEDPEKIDISTDGERLSAPCEAVDDGWRFSIEIPPGAGRLEVEVQGHRAWQLSLAEAHIYERLARARALNDAAASKSIAEESAKSRDPTERARALGMLGRLLLGESAADDAVGALQEAIRLHRQRGCASCVLLDSTVIVYALIHHTREFGGANERLEQIQPASHPDPRARVLVPYYRGLLAAETGDLRAALQLLERAQHAAERLGLVFYASSAAHTRALTLPALGRFEEAVSAMMSLRDSAPADLGSCERAALDHNLGWVGLLAHEAGRPPTRFSLKQVDESLKRALALHQTECRNRSDAGSLLIDLALVALHKDDLDQARRLLHRAEDLLPAEEPRLALWRLDIEGRLAASDGNIGAALRLFNRLALLAANVDAPDAQRRAALGRARALRARGRVEEAIAAYASSERLIEAATRRVALGDGRDTFLGALTRGTEEYVELLVQIGHNQQAAHVARRARRRALTKVARHDRVSSLSRSERLSWEIEVGRYRQLRAEIEQQTRDAWRLAHTARLQQVADIARKRSLLAQTLDRAFAVLDRGSPAESEASVPGPGELLLFYYAPPGTLWAFGETMQGAVAQRIALLGEATPRELVAEQLLGPFDEQIEDADQIRVLSAGLAAAVDVHALSWHGQPLQSARVVAYGLDLPHVTTRTDNLADDPGREDTADRTRPRGAVLVADSRGDLPGARREATVVQSTLEANGFAPVQVLFGGAASAAAVRVELARRDAAHFAGHGEYVSTSSLRSALALADGERLEVADVISLPRVPRVVFLAGCDTARTRSETPVEGLGLAQAFLLAGANAAVATTRPVRDDMSASLSRAFYENLEGVDAWAAARALRSAQLSLMRQQPNADWAAYRAMIP